MLPIQKTILLLLLCCCYQLSFSQEVKRENDKLVQSKKNGNLSKKNKFLSHIPRFLLKGDNPKITRKKYKNKTNFNGKIIRNIEIITLDPFGFSDKDTAKKPASWGEKTGNHLHLKTKEFTIRNLLFFKKNTPYNSYLIKESERIIRTQNFIREVTITEKLSAPKSDSVDVFIRTLDSWSTAPHFEISNSRMVLGLNERNFWGLGHQMNYKYTKRFGDGKNANSLEYQIPNIKNTFIKTILTYRIDLEGHYTKSFSIERPFYSPLTAWAGGILLDQQFRKDSLQGADAAYATQNFKYNSHDFWFAKAFPVVKKDSMNHKTTNLILSTRFLNKNYIESPLAAYDTINFYSSEKLLLMGIGINTREFIEDRYIFKNGIIEDVPIGRIFGLTAGYQYKNENWRPYLGGQLSFGNYHDWGFLSTNLEVGTFFSNANTEQTSYSFQANYFTKLLETKKWKWRQFIKYRMLWGNNRKKSVGDLLTINDNYGIQGFKSAIYGTEKMVLTLQTQAYAPKDIWGFRMNPYFNYSIAVLGNQIDKPQKRKGYSKIGIGLIINNDYWVFSSFQLSLSYYPLIPFEGENLYKSNAFVTSDFGFQSFELAKPRTVLFK